MVAYRSGASLQNCVDSLERQSDQDFEVIIVNNNTPDDCVSTLVLPDNRFKVSESDTNLGFSGGSNLGFIGAQTPYFMTLNPDVRLKKNCLRRLRLVAAENPDASMLAPVLIRSNRKKRIDGVGDVLSIFGIAWRGGFGKKLKKYAPGTTVKIFSPCGGAAIYRKDEFEHHAGFDEAFFCYLEDVDLGIRINASGGYALLVHNAKAFHIGGDSTGKITGFQEFYTSRNNLRMIIKSAPILILPFMLAGYVLSQSWISLRNLHDPRTYFRWKGHKAAIKSIPSSLKARLKRKRYKIGSSFRIARRLVWRRSSLKSLPVNYWNHYHGPKN